MTEVITIVGLLVAMAVSFVFSGMEAGLFALSRVRIRHMMRSGDRRAKVLYRYLDQPERFLWTILVGNTIANFLLVALVVTRLYGSWSMRMPAFWLLLFAVLFGCYVLLDLLPKVLFRRYPNRMCLATVTPFRWLNCVSDTGCYTGGLVRRMADTR